MNASGFSRKQAKARYDFIPPEQAPVKRGGQTMQRKGEIVDAEFEVIRTPMRANYRVLNDNAVAHSSRPARRSHRAWSLLGAAAVLLETLLAKLGARSFAGLVAASVLVVFGTVFFSAGGNAPAPVVEAPGGVAISGVDTSVIDSNGLRILEVRGQVANVTEQDLPAPRLAAEVESVSESPSIIVFNLDEPVLERGKTVPFTLKLPHPGGKVPKVRVSADAATF